MGAGGYKDSPIGQMEHPLVGDDTGWGAGIIWVPSQCPVLCPGPPSSPGERGVPVREGAYSLEMLPLVKLKEKNKTGFLTPNERDLFQC